MKQIVQTSQFKHDLKKVKHAGRYKIEDLLTVAETLAADKPLSEKHKDHALTGNWQAHRECHIKPD